MQWQPQLGVQEYSPHWELLVPREAGGWGPDCLRTMFMTVRMYVVTLALPCFSTIFLSATTRVSTLRPFCDLPADLLGRPELPYSSNLR